jgi:3-oxoacyl-[acyl-carrier-protein] synthase II
VTNENVALEDKLGKRVVVTGVGAVTCLALSAEETWQGLLAGRSGLNIATGFDHDAYSTHVAGQVKGFEPEKYMDRRQARRMARFSQFAIAAAGMALEHANLTIDEALMPRTGVLLGNSAGSLPDLEEGIGRILKGRGTRLSPIFIVTVIPNMAAYQVAQAHNAKGYSATVCTACAAGTQAVGEAAEIIRRGQAEVMLAGGADANISETGLAGFAAMRAMSNYDGDEPGKACRPFNADRDGFVASEGSAVLVLESLEHALARGARIYAEVAGHGVTNDAYHVAAPDPSGAGAVRAMEMALERAGLDTADIDYINAHGPATPLGDVMETTAIKKLFGPRAYNIPLSSTKSMLGHALGAAGAIEALVCVLSLRDNQIHPTINLDDPDPECDLDYVPHTAREVPVEAVMSNSFGLGGQNAVLVLKRYHA